MIRTILTIMALSLATAAGASRPDSTLAEQYSQWNGLRSTAWKNPALHEGAYRHSFTQFYGEVDYSHQSDRFIMQKGTGYALPQLSAESFVRLGKKGNQAFWGKASYTNGRSKQIIWNSVSDYDLLEPGIIGDTIGGDTHRERYQFGGGYGATVRRWHFGGEMLFRAEQEFRRVDPRMRGIVSDLTLKAGAGYDINDAYTLAASFEGNIYHQTTSVDFYKPLGSIAEYQFVGLGATYERFSDDVLDLYFRGGGVALAADLQPKESGLLVNATVSEHRYERLARLLNSLPLTTLYYNAISGEIGWSHEGSLDWAVVAEGAFTKRSEDQHLAGTSSMEVYPIMLDVTAYKNYILHTAAKVMVGRRGDVVWNATVRAGYDNNRSRVAYPRRVMDYNSWFVDAKGQAMLDLSKTITLNATVAASYRNSGKGRMILPRADMDGYFLDMLDHNFAYLTADYTNLCADIRADYHFPQSHYGIFVRGAAGRTWVSTHEHAISLLAAIGLTF